MAADESKSRIAYFNETFLASDAARPLRIIAEYLEPLEAFCREQIKDTIVFFGSARLQENGNLGRYYEEARTLARLITEWSMSLSSPNGRYVVCSGGGGGIMEAANRGACDAGAPSIGFNISLPAEQEPNPYSTPELTFRFHYFAMRKMHLAMRANALAVFPGGFGTMDELFEILTLQQTRKAPPMPIVLFGRDYWHRIVDFDALVEDGMIAAEDLALFALADSPEEGWEAMLRHGLKAHTPPAAAI